MDGSVRQLSFDELVLLVAKLQAELAVLRGHPGAPKASTRSANPGSWSEPMLERSLTPQQQRLRTHHGLLRSHDSNQRHSPHAQTPRLFPACAKMLAVWFLFGSKRSVDLNPVRKHVSDPPNDDGRVPAGTHRMARTQIVSRLLILAGTAPRTAGKAAVAPGVGRDPVVRDVRQRLGQ